MPKKACQIGLSFETGSLSEFDRSLNGERLQEIERSRIAKAKRRVNEEKAPFEQTYFDSWEWDPDEKVYVWEGDKFPKDSQGPLIWKPNLEPTLLEQSTSDPESRS